jgi:hypothetical protein
VPENVFNFDKKKEKYDVLLVQSKLMNTLDLFVEHLKMLYSLIEYFHIDNKENQDLYKQ